MSATEDDRRRVEELLGRPPQGAFEVVVRDEQGAPMVIRNAPLLDDGTPMPTRFWLVDPVLHKRIGTLESSGGVRAAEAAVDGEELRRAHARYAAERDAHVPRDWTGPRPSGGVGGTRQGVKCLHAHYAWHLAGGDDPVGRWTADQLAALARRAAAGESERMTGPTSDHGDIRDQGGTGGRVAAIDCGTNSTRLLVGEVGADGLLVVHERLMRITRLGRGTDATGRLDPAAVERTVAVLREYREVMDRLGVPAGRVRIAATSAARDAANRDEFFDAAEAVVGARPELLSGAQEAQLSFLGATADLDPALGPFLVMDIGGGSTEAAVGTTHAEAFLSLDIGCVRLTEKFLLHDPPLAEELSNCLSVVQAHFNDLEREVPGLRDARTFVGLAGTITTAAAVEIGLVTYDSDRIHHFVLTKQAAEDVFRTLATETVEQRKENPGLDPERADVIVGGLCIFVQAMRQFDLQECLVSEADILDGLALSVARPA